MLKILSGISFLSFPRRRESSQGDFADTLLTASIAMLARSLDSRLRGNDGV